ncbi:MAG: acyl-CoA dehydrogenase family protein [Mycobacteriales bacterium]
MLFEHRAEHDELRQALRAFLADVASESETRRLMETPEGYDPQVWSRLAAELGLAGLGVPEELGGAGGSAVEVGIVMEELGRSLACTPFFATAVLATSALLLSGDEEHLPRIAAGACLATVAVAEASGSWDVDEISTRAAEDGGSWWLDGEKLFVLDGLIADLIVVAARTGPTETSLFLVEGNAVGLTRSAMTTLDPTRKQARLTFEHTPAQLLGNRAAAPKVLPAVLDRALVALAAEQVGGAQRCLEMAVEYAGTREQFGRAIASFQAIKHRCADMLVGIEGARSAAYYGLWAAAESPTELPVAAGVAAIRCSDAYVFASNENVQVHGGMGFTWEHPAHLYVRRARSSQLLFGDPARQRERLATALEV